MPGKLLPHGKDPKAIDKFHRDMLAAADRFKAHFDALPETEQILTLHYAELVIAYGVYDRAGKPREEVARESLRRRFGPKFAERVLGNDAYRKLLAIDEAPADTGDYPGTI